VAHRLAYELVIGVIPKGLVLDHLCKRRNCVKPTHLEAVTNLENIERGLVGASRRTHCEHGHPLNEANTIHQFNSAGKKKGRKCRICMEIYIVNDKDLASIELNWTRTESGNYYTEDHPFKVFRMGSKWHLEQHGKGVPRSFYGVQTFPTLKEARGAATMLLRQEMSQEVVLLRLEAWRRQNPEIASEWDLQEWRRQRVNFDWEKIESGNYLSRVHSYRVFRSDKMWYLEVDRDLIERVFDTRELAFEEARVLFLNLPSPN